MNKLKKEQRKEFKKAVNYLKKRGYWEKLLEVFDEETFDISNPHNCIYGQLFEDERKKYISGYKYAHYNLNLNILPPFWNGDYQDAWIKKIRKERKKSMKLSKKDLRIKKLENKLKILEDSNQRLRDRIETYEGRFDKILALSEY